MKVSVSENIKTNRKRHNLTQQQLAEKLNVARQTVASYESGRTEPDIATLESIAKVFDISVDQLIGNPASKQKLPTLNKIGLFAGVVLNSVLLARALLFYVRNKFFYLQPGILSEDMKKILEIRMSISNVTDIMERIYSPLLTVCIILLISYKIHFSKQYRLIDLIKVFVLVMLSQFLITGFFCIIDPVTTTTDYMYIITMGYFFNLDNILIIVAFAVGYFIWTKYKNNKKEQMQTENKGGE